MPHAPLLLALALASAVASPARGPNILLVTLDTTRADHLGCYGFRGASTPHLDALAGRGTRYAHALSPAPLTLPAHASILTGLDPPAHGLHENGTSSLSREVPTLATALLGRGYATAAFVSSLVLDRRFGLDRSFQTYDDRMTAEARGEYGYPERDARAVTDAALDWLSRAPRAPFFLWVHYYDPHSPYQPPAPFLAGTASAYDGEISYVDRELGRLLASLRRSDSVIAVVGDHGESLGEHGERAHGLLLHRGVLEVPLLVAGPAVPRGVVVETVSTKRLAPTLVALAGLATDARRFGTPLPGLGFGKSAPEGVYGETEMPARAFGWRSLRSFTREGLRLVVGGRNELFDLSRDPEERDDLFASRREDASTLKRALDAYVASLARREAKASGTDEALRASMASLGYLSGGTEKEDALDPRDGVRLLADYDRATALVREGKPAEAEAILDRLVARSPRSIPFVTELAHSRVRAGNLEGAVREYREALALNPALSFLHYNLAEGLREKGDEAAARAEYRTTLDLDPRHAPSWLRLSELAAKAGKPVDARRLLAEAVGAGTRSATLLSRLAELELEAGDPASAEKHAREALRLAPAWPAAARVLERLTSKRR